MKPRKQFFRILPVVVLLLAGCVSDAELSRALGPALAPVMGSVVQAMSEKDLYESMPPKPGYVLTYPVDNLMMINFAEKSLEKGCRYFIILNKESDCRQGDVIQMDSGEDFFLVVRGFKDKPQTTFPVFDAQEIKKIAKERYRVEFNKTDIRITKH